MHVYLASPGLIASRLAIYKQASLKNNECVKSINTNSRWGNWRLGGGGKSAGLYNFQMKEDANWSKPFQEGKAEQTPFKVAARPLAESWAAFNLSQQCNLYRVNWQLTRWSCDLSQLCSGGAFFHPPHPRTSARHIREGPWMLEHHAKCGTFPICRRSRPFSSL
jgi:hypothetical protein